MILDIDHVQLAMPPGGEDVARKFYRDILGLDEIEKPPKLALRGGCWFQGAVSVHLGIESDFRPALKAHPAFVVADLAKCADLLMVAGFPVNWDTNNPNVKRFFSADPFGNRIEFLE
ncbi:MAG: glyoxalase [Leptolyngbya sp. SIOISBB]|nr:glyoxalase [Leptolyngbya sp. SIOISBB]